MASANALRNDAGTYLLWLRANEAHTVKVGRLGTLSVQPGVYGYVGSAFGPGGVGARVRRHLRKRDKALHWHVDYLRAVTRLEAVWLTYDDVRRECTWAAHLRALSVGDPPLDGFGASDCDCPSHLVRFTSRPPLPVFRERLRAATHGHAPVHALRSSDEAGEDR